MKMKYLGLVLTCLLAGCNSQDQAGKPNARGAEYGDPNAPYPTTTIGASMNDLEAKNSFLQASYSGLRLGAKNNPSVTLLLETTEGNQEFQPQQVQQLLDKGAKGLVLNIVNPTAGDRIVQKMLADLCAKNIPVVYYNRDPGAKEMAACDKAYLISGDDVQAAVEQGLQILDAWEANPSWDKNGDGVIQYAIIKTTEGVRLTAERSRWAINTLQRYPKRGKPVQEIFSGNADFSAALAEGVVDQWIADPKFSQVEVIFGNTDDVALGAANAVKKHGLQVPVFGADGTVPGFEAVKSGLLAGTVAGKYDEQASYALRMAANLATNRPVLEGVPYKVEHRIVLTPFFRVDKNNVDEYLNAAAANK